MLLLCGVFSSVCSERLSRLTANVAANMIGPGSIVVGCLSFSVAENVSTPVKKCKIDTSAATASYHAYEDMEWPSPSISNNFVSLSILNR